MESMEEAYAQGWCDASRIMDRDAFFEIGMAVFFFVVGCFSGWVGANL